MACIQWVRERLLENEVKQQLMAKGYQTTVCGPNLASCFCKQFYWNEATVTGLQILHAYFCTTVTSDIGHMAHET